MSDGYKVGRYTLVLRFPSFSAQPSGMSSTFGECYPFVTSATNIDISAIDGVCLTTPRRSKRPASLARYPSPPLSQPRRLSSNTPSGIHRPSSRRDSVRPLLTTPPASVDSSRTRSASFLRPTPPRFSLSTPKKRRIYSVTPEEETRSERALSHPSDIPSDSDSAEEENTAIPKKCSTTSVYRAPNATWSQHTFIATPPMIPRLMIDLTENVMVLDTDLEDNYDGDEDDENDVMHSLGLAPMDDDFDMEETPRPEIPTAHPDRWAEDPWETDAQRPLDELPVGGPPENLVDLSERSRFQSASSYHSLSFVYEN